MSVLSVSSIYQDDDQRVYVTAMVDDAILTFGQTLYDPAEYGPALCESSFPCNDDMIVPDDEDELIEFLNDLDLEWTLVDNSDDYYDESDYTYY